MYSLRMRAAGSSLLTFMLACTDYPSAPATPLIPQTPPRLAPELIVSDPIPVEFTGGDGMTTVTYVSVRPGMLPDVGTARIWSSRQPSAARQVTIVEGGFDPQPLFAHAGDSIRLELTTAAGVLSTAFNIVPQARAPIVIRITPQSNENNVPIDMRIVVVFSEPIRDLLSDSPLQLRRGDTMVESGLQSGIGWQLELRPVKPLEFATTYAIHISESITDASGLRLEAVLTSAFTTAAPVAPISDLDRLSGFWEATKWEFFADQDFKVRIDEMVAAGLAGTLNILRRDRNSFNWEWRETYRWWGPQWPTIFRGVATLQNSILRATVTFAQTPFECDWGDCEGPLHGEHRFTLVDNELVITRVGPVDYFRLTGPQAAYSRITLVLMHNDS